MSDSPRRHPLHSSFAQPQTLQVQSFLPGDISLPRSQEDLYQTIPFTAIASSPSTVISFSTSSPKKSKALSKVNSLPLATLTNSSTSSRHRQSRDINIPPTASSLLKTSRGSLPSSVSSSAAVVSSTLVQKTAVRETLNSSHSRQSSSSTITRLGSDSEEDKEKGSSSSSFLSFSKRSSRIATPSVPSLSRSWMNPSVSTNRTATNETTVAITTGQTENNSDFEADNNAIDHQQQQHSLADNPDPLSGTQESIIEAFNVRRRTELQRNQSYSRAMNQSIGSLNSNNYLSVAVLSKMSPSASGQESSPRSSDRSRRLPAHLTAYPPSPSRSSKASEESSSYPSTISKKKQKKNELPTTDTAEPGVPEPATKMEDETKRTKFVIRAPRDLPGLPEAFQKRGAIRSVPVTGPEDILLPSTDIVPIRGPGLRQENGKRTHKDMMADEREHHRHSGDSALSQEKKLKRLPISIPAHLLQHKNLAIRTTKPLFAENKQGIESKMDRSAMDVDYSLSLSRSNGPSSSSPFSATAPSSNGWASASGRGLGSSSGKGKRSSVKSNSETSSPSSTPAPSDMFAAAAGSSSLPQQQIAAGSGSGSVPVLAAPVHSHGTRFADSGPVQLSTLPEGSVVPRGSVLIPPTASLTETLSPIELVRVGTAILDKLLSNPISKSFVNRVPLSATNYYAVIKKPMDLMTIESRLWKSLEAAPSIPPATGATPQVGMSAAVAATSAGLDGYHTLADFERDLRRIVQNATHYNASNHIIYKQALDFQALCNRLLGDYRLGTLPLPNPMPQEAYKPTLISLEEPGSVYLSRAHTPREMERRMTDVANDLFSHFHQPLFTLAAEESQMSIENPYFVRMYISKNRSILTKCRDDWNGKLVILTDVNIHKITTPEDSTASASHTGEDFLMQDAAPVAPAPGRRKTFQDGSGSMVRMTARAIVGKPLGERVEMTTVGDMDCPNAWITVACVKTLKVDVEIPAKFEKGTLSKMRHEVIAYEMGNKFSAEHQKAFVDALGLKLGTPMGGSSRGYGGHSVYHNPAAGVGLSSGPIVPFGLISAGSTSTAPTSTTSSLSVTTLATTMPEVKTEQVDLSTMTKRPAALASSSATASSSSSAASPSSSKSAFTSTSASPLSAGKHGQKNNRIRLSIAGGNGNYTVSNHSNNRVEIRDEGENGRFLITLRISSTNTTATSSRSSTSVSSSPKLKGAGIGSAATLTPPPTQDDTQLTMPHPPLLPTSVPLPMSLPPLPYFPSRERIVDETGMTKREQQLLRDLKASAAYKLVPYTTWTTLEPTLIVDSAHGLFKQIYHVRDDSSVVVQNFKEMDADSFEQRVREVACLLRLRNHPGVGQIQAVIEDEKAHLVGLSMTKYAYTLKDYATNARRHPTPCQKLRLIQDMVGAMAAIHGAGLAHRDLSEVNIMVDEDPVEKLADQSPKPLVRVIDFGKSVFVERDEVKRWSMQDEVPDQELDLLPRVILPPDHGYKLYRSILTLPKTKYDHTMLAPVDPRSEDVYSLGVLIWRTFSGKSPWNGAIEDDIKKIRYLVSSDEQIRFQLMREVVGKTSRELLLKCLTATQETRASARDLEVWLQQADVQEQLIREFEALGGGRKKVRKNLD